MPHAKGHKQYTKKDMMTPSILDKMSQSEIMENLIRLKLIDPSKDFKKGGDVKKTKPKDFEKFIDKLYTIGVHDLKIIENFEIQESEEFDIDEEENTLSILNRYIDESEFNLDKNIIKGIFQDLYSQACEVE